MEDFNAAMSRPPAPAPDTEPDFNAAMTPKKRGRPASLKNGQLNPKTETLSINNIYIDKSDNIDSSYNSCIINQDIKDNPINIKAKLTNQELTFLEIYFNSRHLKGQERFTIDSAMISAGYGHLSHSHRYRLARDIVRKYEKTAPDSRKIFQALGFGPVRTALGIIRHAEESPPTVSLNALKLAAACQGMIEQTQDAAAGITINILTAPTPSPAGNPDPSPAGPGPVVEVQTTIPRKPLQITR
jgi:hypothetical protein